MRAKAASFFQHPRWVAALVIATAVPILSFSLHSIASQIGRPFPGFIYTQPILLPFIRAYLFLAFLCVIGILVHLPPTDSVDPDSRSQHQVRLRSARGHASLLENRVY